MQFLGQLQLFSRLRDLCHRLEHQVSNERGADLIRASLPEDHCQRHATEQHRPDKQLPVWLVLAVLCAFKA